MPQGPTASTSNLQLLLLRQRRGKHPRKRYPRNPPRTTHLRPEHGIRTVKAGRRAPVRFCNTANRHPSPRAPNRTSNRRHAARHLERNRSNPSHAPIRHHNRRASQTRRVAPLAPCRHSCRHCYRHRTFLRGCCGNTRLERRNLQHRQPPSLPLDA